MSRRILRLLNEGKLSRHFASTLSKLVSKRWPLDRDPWKQESKVPDWVLSVAAYMFITSAFGDE